MYSMFGSILNKLRAMDKVYSHFAKYTNVPLYAHLLCQFFRVNPGV